MNKISRAKVSVTVLGLGVAAAGIVVAVTLGGIARVAGIAAALAGAIVVVLCALIPQKQELTSAKYARKKRIMTACEAEFFDTLKGIAAGRYEVFPQVALVSLVDKVTQSAYRNELFRIVDFVLADRNTFAPLLAVELNDSSHLKAERKLRDEKVAEICKKAKLPLVTFTTRQARDAAFVRREIMHSVLKR